MNCYIRSVEVIDRTLPDLAPLFDEMRDRLHDEHGITRARYYHAVPVADGARLAVSASPPVRALAEDYVRNRRHEIDHLLLERMRLAEPTVWDRERRDEGCPPRMRRDPTALGVRLRRRSSARAGGTASTLPPSARAAGAAFSRSMPRSSSRSAAATWARCGMCCRTSTSPTAGRAGGRAEDQAGARRPGGARRRRGRPEDRRHRPRARHHQPRCRGAPGASAQVARLPDHHRGRRQGGGARDLFSRPGSECGISHRLWNFPASRINLKLFQLPSSFRSEGSAPTCSAAYGSRS